MKNLTAFKALIVLYKSITLKDIDKSAKKHPLKYNTEDTSVANNLTRFGCHGTCILCQGISCKDCVYNHIKGIKYDESKCYKAANANTYYRIMNALDRKTLKKVFQARAKHMETLLLLLNK